jgi:hypothetical protein
VTVEPGAPLVRPAKTFAAATCLLLTVLTAVMTWPQAIHMRDGVNDVGDPLLNAWALSWVAHELPIAPARIFDANIFHPEPHTLTFSETLLAPALAVAPLRWLGVGSILVYNIVFLSGFVVSGVGTTLLVYALTGDRGAGLVAGIIFAFLPYRIDHYAHLQLQQTQFIPLALWALHKVAESGRVRDGALVGAAVAGQLLSCMYYGIFLVPYLAVVAAVLLVKGRVSTTHANGLVDLTLRFDPGWWRTRAVALTAGALVCLAIVGPAGRAYLAARTTVGERGIEEIERGSATWRNLAATSELNVLYGRWADTFGSPERRLFAGIVPMALALVALWPPVSRVRIAYAAAFIFAVDMSLGVNGLTYRFLYDHLLPFRALRVPARMGLLVGFSLAVLAGLGVARLGRGIPPRRRTWLAAGCCALVLLEYRSQPLDLASIPRKPPAIYADLVRADTDGAAPIVELPIAQEDPTYMYYSTFHWRPLVNGYSGFFPASYGHLADVLRTLPSDEGFAALREHGARYVLVHGELMTWNNYRRLIAALDLRPELTLVSRRPWQKSEISLYHLPD